MAFIQKALSKVFTKSLSGCHAIDQLIDDSKLHWIEGSQFTITQTSKNDVLYTTRNVNDNKVTEALLPLGPQEKLTPEFIATFSKIHSIPTSRYINPPNINKFRRYPSLLKNRNKWITGFTKHENTYYLVAHRSFWVYGYCAVCKILRCSAVWCICGQKELRGTAAADKRLDKFVKKSQKQTKSANEAYLEWIPFPWIIFDNEATSGSLYADAVFHGRVELIPFDVPDKDSLFYYKLCVDHPDILNTNVWITIGFTSDPKQKKYYIIKTPHKNELYYRLCKGCVNDLRVRISTYCCRCHEEKSPNDMSPDLVVKPGKTNSADQQETEFTHLEDISLDEDSRTADQAEANGAEVSNDSKNIKVAGSRSKSDIPDITFTPVASSYDNSAKSTDNVSSDTHSGSQRKSQASASNTDSRNATNSQSIPSSWKSTQKSAPDADGWNSTGIRSALDVGGWSPPNWTIDDTANWTPPDWSTSDTGDGHGPANRSAPNVDNWGAPDSGSRHRPNFGWSSTSRPYERKNNTWTDNVMSEDWGEKRSSNNIPRDDHRKKGEKESSVRICYFCKKPGHVSKDCPDKVCHNCSKPGHTAKDCPDKTNEVICHNCSKPGHTAKDCPDKTNEVICHNCSKPGHTIKDCPTKRCKYCKKPGHFIRECPSLNRNKNDFRPTPEQHSGDFDNDRSRSHQRESDKAQKSRSSSVSSQSYRQFGWQIPIKESSSPDLSTLSSEKNVASDKQNNAASKQGPKRRKPRDAKPSNANIEGDRNDDENSDNKNYKDLMMAFQEIQKGMKSNKGTSNACSDSESGNGKDDKSNADEEEEDTGVQPVMESYVRWRNTEAEDVLTLMKEISENQQTEGDGDKSDDENKEVIKDDDGWIPPEEYDW